MPDLTTGEVLTEANRMRSLTLDYLAFVGLAYAITWSLVIAGVKLGWSEDSLNLSTAGPAVAALILSAIGSGSSKTGRMQWLWFLSFLPLCWVVLSLRSSWWNSENGLPIHMRPIQLIPAIAPAWILSAFASRNSGARDIGRRLIQRPGRWSGFALLFFPVLLGIPSAIAYLCGARLVWPGLGGITLTSVATAIIALFSNTLYAGVQEEPGWRGFLLDRLQSRFSPLSASLLVWLSWAVWHGPIDYYRPVRFTLVQEILLRVVTLIPLTIILTWFYNGSKRSIQVVVLFHAAMNTFPYVAAYYPAAWSTIFLFTIYIVIKDRMWATLSRTTDIDEIEPFTTDSSARLGAKSPR